MAEKALSDALEMAGLAAADLDVLVVVTCTPDQPRFSHDAMELHRRLGGRRDAHCLVVDSGCGGSLYVLDMLARLAAAESLRHVAVVGTNLTSPLIDRDVYTSSRMVGADGEDVRAYLSTYVFGDGAGAVVLCREAPTGAGIRVSLAGNDHEELVRSPGGGAQSPPYGLRYNPLDHAFVVNGRLVAQSYLRTMRACISAVTRAAACAPSQVDRLYLHQPNARVPSPADGRSGGSRRSGGDQRRPGRQHFVGGDVHLAGRRSEAGSGDPGLWQHRGCGCRRCGRPLRGAAHSALTLFARSLDRFQVAGLGACSAAARH